MWLFLNDAFLSIVKEKGRHPTGRPFLVRARRAEDLRWHFGGAIKCTPERDYRYRTWASKESVMAVLAKAVDTLDYTNFKDSVPKHDRDRKAAYGRVWQVMADFQPVPPYGGRWLTYMPDDEPLRLAPKRKPKRRKPYQGTLPGLAGDLPEAQTPAGRRAIKRASKE